MHTIIFCLYNGYYLFSNSLQSNNMKQAKTGVVTIVVLMLVFSCKMAQENSTQKSQKREVWTEETANSWYKKQPWLIGANFIPSTAINQLEMWQAETFDTATIDKELRLAASLGMNTVRVFLHDLLYLNDKEGLYSRIKIFLRVAEKHGIKPMLVFFDSCWDPFPKAGKQRPPKPFTHNSGWVQSPGYYALRDTMQYRRLENYVTETVAHFASDQRILGWDVWNEPDNMTGPSYEKVEMPDKVAYVLPLLAKSFSWVRAANPSQMVTSGIWLGNWSNADSMLPIQKLQLEQSDVISFHNYDRPEEFEKRVKALQRYKKPLLCTEYMARPNGSTFQGVLPIARKYHVAMYNWGFVSGKTQTIYPWDSWTKTYTGEPPVWFHDIFRTDGTPYDKNETDFIKSITKSNTISLVN